MEANNEKIIKFILNHETQYLRSGYNYPVSKEDKLFYYINFGGTLIKYPKFYFIVVNE